MVIKLKKIRLLLLLSGALGVSGCSALSFLNVDAVDDNVNYRASSDSIKALAIPPGLSDPGFNDTYTVQQGKPVGMTAGADASTRSVATPPQQSRVAGALQEQQQAATVVSASRIPEKPATAVVQTQQQATRSASAPAARPQVQASSRSSSGLPRVAMVRLKSGEPALGIQAPRAKTWGLIAGMLGKVGLQIQKQQPDQGLFTTVYQGGAGNASASGGRSLGSIASALNNGAGASSSGALQNGATYLVLVAEAKSGNSFIGIANSNGKPASDAVANQLLGRLKAQFER